MIVVSIEMKRCKAGYTYTLLRVLNGEEDLERMQSEYPFPLSIVINSPGVEFPYDKLREYRVEDKEGWYYSRPRVNQILKINPEL